MRTKLILITLMAIFFFNANSVQAGFTCDGKPQVNMSLQTGTLTVNVGYGYWYICSINTTVGNITPKACEKIYEGLLSAEILNNRSSIYFEDSLGNCNSIGSWSWPTPAPYHIDFLLDPTN